MFYTVIPFEEDNGKGDKDKIDTFLKYIETYVERAAKIQGYATSLLALSKEKSFNTIGILAPMFWNCVVSSFWCSMIIDITSFLDGIFLLHSISLKYTCPSLPKFIFSDKSLCAIYLLF